MIGARVLYGAAAGCTLLGVALRVAPAPQPDEGAVAAAPRAPLPAPPAAVAGPEGDPGSYDVIVANNVFSPTRTPPEARFSPAGSVVEEPAPEPEPLVEEPPPLRLVGIARGAGQALALIEANEAVPGAELYQVGDRIQDGRIRSIGDSTVVVAYADGPLVLRLPSGRRSEAARAADDAAFGAGRAAPDTGAADDTVRAGAAADTAAALDAAPPAPRSAPSAPASPAPERSVPR